MLLSPKSDTYAAFSQHKILAPEKLSQLVPEHKRLGKKIVTLNGSFDLFHAGHLEIIYQASLQGDLLIVALNTDASIKQYKGAHRPFIPLEQRMQLIAALGMVDYVTWFEELDPCALLSTIKPDVHVNGAEYGENCIEAETVKSHGGRVHIVELVAGLSTSNILKKIASSQESGAQCV